ncbi:MAG: LCP family protein [Lachnospiraceae bacterium]|nr:LCP family protein [Lachnospiraceae bacterium]
MATNRRRPAYEDDDREYRRRPSNGGRPASGGKKRSSAKAKAKKKKKKIILFVIEIFVLLLMLGVLYLTLKTEKMQKVTINEEDIVINEQVAESTVMKGYRNIALFGVDSREGALGKGTRTDTIIIASINEDTHEVKLSSIYRDTYLNLGNDSYNKANSAYAKGGPEQAINMLNMNLDMNITDYVTCGFAGLVDTIDELGGVEIDVDSAEIGHLNNYGLCIAEDLNTKYAPVKDTGFQNLTGLQATAYCRIRYTKGDDFKRAERQREVLMAVAEKAKKANVSTLNTIANKVFPQVATSLDLSEILSLMGNVADYSIVDNTGFPFETNRTTGNIGKKGSCVVPLSLADNVELLHKFFFNDQNYTASKDVKAYSAEIESETSQYVGKSKSAE